MTELKEPKAYFHRGYVSPLQKVIALLREVGGERQREKWTGEESTSVQLGDRKIEHVWRKLLRASILP